LRIDFQVLQNSLSLSLFIFLAQVHKG
jgi:hypothetical protein